MTIIKKTPYRGRTSRTTARRTGSYRHVCISIVRCSLRASCVTSALYILRTRRAQTVLLFVRRKVTGRRPSPFCTPSGFTIFFFLLLLFYVDNMREMNNIEEHVTRTYRRRVHSPSSSRVRMYDTVCRRRLHI